jgi:hypothetical protein
VNDLRAVPDPLLKAYLYAVALWAIALALLFAAGLLPYALLFCFPLALWLIGLTGWWWVRHASPSHPDPLAPDEVAAGSRTIGRILALSSLLPGAVFLADDPLAPSAWSAVGGVAVIAAVAFVLADRVAPRVGRSGLVAVLGACGAALPINTTGSLSLAWFIGLFDTALALVPT